MKTKHSEQQIISLIFEAERKLDLATSGSREMSARRQLYKLKLELANHWQGIDDNTVAFALEYFESRYGNGTFNGRTEAAIGLQFGEPPIFISGRGYYIRPALWLEYQNNLQPCTQ